MRRTLWIGPLLASLLLDCGTTPPPKKQRAPTPTSKEATVESPSPRAAPSGATPTESRPKHETAGSFVISETRTSSGSTTGIAPITGGTFGFSPGGDLHYEAGVSGDVAVFDADSGGVILLTTGLTRDEIEALAAEKKIRITKLSDDWWKVGNQEIGFENDRFSRVRSR